MAESNIDKTTDVTEEVEELASSLGPLLSVSPPLEDSGASESTPLPEIPVSAAWQQIEKLHDNHKGPLGEIWKGTKAVTGQKGSTQWGGNPWHEPSELLYRRAKELHDMANALGCLPWAFKKNEAGPVVRELGEFESLKSLVSKIQSNQSELQSVITTKSQPLVQQCHFLWSNLEPLILRWKSYIELLDRNEQAATFLCKIAKKPPDASWNDVLAGWKNVTALAGRGEHAKAAQAFESLVQQSERMKKLALDKARFDELYGSKESDCEFLHGLFRGTPNPLWADVFPAGRSLFKHMELGNFDQAYTLLSELLADVSELRVRARKHDAEAGKQAKAAESKFATIIEFVPEPETDLEMYLEEHLGEVIAALKSAGRDERLEVLKGLHAPSGELSEEQRLIQRAVYAATELDEKFLKEDQRIRQAYREELSNDTELQDAVADWDATGDEKQKEWIVHIARVQCGTFPIEVEAPEIQWVNAPPTEHGNYNQVTEILTLNPLFLEDVKQIVDTVLHECTHRYQHVLANMFLAGQITQEEHADIYAQAEMFAYTFHLDAYVSPDEDHETYKLQPCEAHAISLGNDESPLLVEQLRSKRSARLG